MYKKIIYYGVMFIVMGIVVWTFTNKIFCNILDRELQESSKTIDELEQSNQIRLGIIEHLKKNERRHQNTITQLNKELEQASDTIRRQAIVIYELEKSTGSRKATITELIQIFDQNKTHTQN